MVWQMPFKQMKDPIYFLYKAQLLVHHMDGANTSTGNPFTPSIHFVMNVGGTKHGCCLLCPLPSSHFRQLDSALGNQPL
jgi:hypothetical protein